MALSLFHPAVREWFTVRLRRARGPDQRLGAADHPRGVDPPPCATGIGQDAGRFSVVPEPADVRAEPERKRCRVLYVSPSRRSLLMSSATFGPRSPGSPGRAAAEKARFIPSIGPHRHADQ